MKRILDLTISLIGIFVLSPVLAVFLFFVYRHDRSTPFYLATRVGLNGNLFSAVKIRSMVVAADTSGVDSTAIDDPRVTPIGAFIRKYKLDEVTQLWNVVTGEMSLVGPRPNVPQDVTLYSPVESRLLSVRPGITDFSSIIFSDEGEILKHSLDPDLAYNQLIRPWKSKLGLLYIDNRSITLDIKLIVLTVYAVINRKNALRLLNKGLRKLTDDLELLSVCCRIKPLRPSIPPGLNEIVRSR